MIAVFYHLGQIGESWKDIYTEHMERLEPVLKEATVFFLHVEGEEELPFAPRNAVVVRNSDGFKHEGDTLVALSNFCNKAGSGWRVLYTHSKGVTRRGKEYSYAVERWTSLLFDEVVDQRQKYLEALTLFGVAGPLYQKYTPIGQNIDNLHLLYDSSFPHYAGNFWWATSEYIRSLDQEYLYEWPINKGLAFESWCCTGPAHQICRSLGLHNYNQYVYIEEVWDTSEWSPEVWYIGKAPPAEYINWLDGQKFISKWIVETETPELYEGMENVVVCSDINEEYIRKPAAKNVWYFCPGTSKFLFKVTDREALNIELKMVGVVQQYNLFYKAEYTHALYSYKNERLRLTESEERISCKYGESPEGIDIWLG